MAIVDQNADMITKGFLCALAMETLSFGAVEDSNPRRRLCQYSVDLYQLLSQCSVTVTMQDPYPCKMFQVVVYETNGSLPRYRVTSTGSFWFTTGEHEHVQAYGGASHDEICQFFRMGADTMEQLSTPKLQISPALEWRAHTFLPQTETNELLATQFTKQLSQSTSKYILWASAEESKVHGEEDILVTTNMDETYAHCPSVVSINGTSVDLSMISCGHPNFMIQLSRINRFQSINDLNVMGTPTTTPSKINW